MTLSRLVHSTEKLLNSHRLDELTVSEIVRAAGSSVGAFYGRFPDKEALLAYIDETYARQGLAAWREFLEPQRWEGKPLRSIVSAIVSRLANGHREKSGVARALYLYVRSQAPPEIVTRAREVNRSVEDLIVGLLMKRRRELRSRNPRIAIRTALLFTVTAIREAVLFEELELHTRLRGGDAELIDELCRAFCAYVQAPAASRRKRVN